MMILRRNTMKRPHLQWKDGDFKAISPAAPPKLDVNVSIMHTAHKKFGLVWNGSRKCAFNTHNIQAIADTGCQTCTIGKEILQVLHCPENYMVPTSHRIVGITASSLGIIGAILLRIELKGRTTMQMVYISERIKGKELYLSETALKELDVIPESFPYPSCGLSAVLSADGNQTQRNRSPAQSFPSVSSNLAEGDVGGEEISKPHQNCLCSERTATPAYPDSLPFPPTKENVHHLKKWLINAFASSAFNKCEHRPIPAMTGAKLDATFIECATPVAYHTPIPVAHHWK